MNMQGVESETKISREQQEQKKVDLVIFDDECDDLGDFTSSNYESQVYNEEGSVMSEDTEKKRKN